MAKQWLEKAKLRFKKRELLPLSTLGLQIRPEKADLGLSEVSESHYKASEGQFEACED